MKTKHLFFAAALPLAFAACTNEDFATVNGQSEIGSDQRPLVEVKLDFQKGDANTRVDYDGIKYSWEGTDTIGAFLMDEIAQQDVRPFGSTADEWNKLTWIERYKLVDYIHTDYPFSWSTSESAWVAPSKLQEGNYFFAAPYETYNGERQMIHYIDGQTQTGGTVESMNEAISKNQYFIGYAQVKAGTGNKEALKSVIMTPVLAPVKVTLRNIGTLAKDVEKVIIRGTNVATALTVNPTNAIYGGTDPTTGEVDKTSQKYNAGYYEDGTLYMSSNSFNYANFIGAKEDLYWHYSQTDFVYNIESGATDYNQADALRQAVKCSYSVKGQIPEYEKQAVLSFTSPVTVNPNGGEIYFAVMVNTLDKVEGDLKMDIITTQGQITDIDLTLAKEEEVGTDGLDPNTVLLNKAITSLKPGTKNELIIQFDNNSVVKSSTKNIQDEDELLAFINWNAENTRLNTATLQRDVRFTKEMYDALTADSYKGRLAIKYTESDKNKAKLLVDNDVPTDVLNVLDLNTTNVVVVLDGERELTKDIADKLKNGSLTIENIGTMAINEDVTTYVQLNNYGTINIAESAKLNGTSSNTKLYNYGMVVNEGEFYNLNNVVDTDREAKGWVKTGKKNHFARNATDATIQLMNIEDEVTGSVSDGTIYFETAEGVKASDLTSVKDKRKVGVTKLLVTGGTIDFDNCDNSSVKELTINGTVSVEGWNNATPRVSTYHKFTGVTEASINGNVTFTNAGIEGSSDVTFEAESALSFNKEVNFKDVTFIKGATVNVANGATVTVDNVIWNANNITNLGTFQYVTSTNDNYTVIAGNDIEQKPATSDPEEDKNVTVTVNVVYGNDTDVPNLTPTADNEVTYKISDYTGWKTLATLKDNDDNDGIEYTYVIGDIEINTAIGSNDQLWSTKDGNVDYWTYFKQVVNGKDVTLNANIGGLNSQYGISLNKLTLVGERTINSGDSYNTGVVFLKVNSFDYSQAVSKINIFNGFIQVNGNAAVGSTTGVSHPSTAVTLGTQAGYTTGKLVIENIDSNSTYLQWDFNNKKWGAWN